MLTMHVVNATAWLACCGVWTWRSIAYPQAAAGAVATGVAAGVMIFLAYRSWRDQ